MQEANTPANEEPTLNKPGTGSFGQPKITPKAQDPKKEDSKKLEKANALFAGIGGGSTKKDDSSDSDSDKKKKKKDKKKDEEIKVSGDLLALDGGDLKKTTV